MKTLTLCLSSGPADGAGNRLSCAFLIGHSGAHSWSTLAPDDGAPWVVPGRCEHPSVSVHRVTVGGVSGPIHAYLCRCDACGIRELATTAWPDWVKRRMHNVVAMPGEPRIEAGKGASDDRD